MSSYSLHLTRAEKEGKNWARDSPNPLRGFSCYCVRYYLDFSLSNRLVRIGSSGLVASSSFIRIGLFYFVFLCLVIFGRAVISLSLFGRDSVAHCLDGGI